MKESYGEDLASRSGLEPYADGGNVVGVASARGTGRPAIELRNQVIRAPTLSNLREGYIDDGVIGKPPSGTCRWTLRSRRTCACLNTPIARTGRSRGFPPQAERSENVTDGTTDMHATGSQMSP